MCVTTGVNASVLNTKNMVLNYLQIKNALIEGNADQAKEISNNVLNDIETFINIKEQKKIYDAVFKIANTNEIEKQRKSFAVLSVELWSLIKSDKNIGMTLFYHYCPMKKFYWISEFDDIKNPYYGKQMLTCGVSKESNK